MKLRRRKHVLIDGADATRLFPALIWRGDREAAAAVLDAPRLLDRSDPRVSRALRLLTELREGAPVKPKRTGGARRPKIAVKLKTQRRP